MTKLFYCTFVPHTILKINFQDCNKMFTLIDCGKVSPVMEHKRLIKIHWGYYSHTPLPKEDKGGTKIKRGETGKWFSMQFILFYPTRSYRKQNSSIDMKNYHLKGRLNSGKGIRPLAGRWWFKFRLGHTVYQRLSKQGRGFSTLKMLFRVYAVLG